MQNEIVFLLLWRSSSIHMTTGSLKSCMNVVGIFTLCRIIFHSPEYQCGACTRCQICHSKVYIWWPGKCHWEVCRPSGTTKLTIYHLVCIWYLFYKGPNVSEDSGYQCQPRHCVQHSSEFLDISLFQMYSYLNSHRSLWKSTGKITPITMCTCHDVSGSFFLETWTHYSQCVPHLKTGSVLK